MIADLSRDRVQNRRQIAKVGSYNITEEDMQDPHINYYVKRNPGYGEGDGLVFLCPANMANLYYYLITKGKLKKMIAKSLSKLLPFSKPSRSRQARLESTAL